MSLLSVLVVDDEPLARRRLVRMLTKIDWVGTVEEAPNAGEAAKAIAQRPPDILLLDIQMPGGSGFDVLDDLGASPPAVIFVTAFDHHALRAFEANAIDYVTKPVETGRFLRAMGRARTSVAQRQQADRVAELQETVAALKGALSENIRRPVEFWVKARGDYLRLTLDQIIRFQAERDYVRIHAAGANYLFQESLASLERRLDGEEFLRVHRGAILRRSAIMRLRPAPFGALIAVLSDGAEVRIGRTYLASIRARLIHA